MSGEEKSENELLLAERFESLFLIGLLNNDVTMEGQNSIPPKQTEISGGLFKQVLHSIIPAS